MSWSPIVSTCRIVPITGTTRCWMSVFSVILVLGFLYLKLIFDVFSVSGVMISKDLWWLRLDHLKVSCYLNHWWVYSYKEVNLIYLLIYMKWRRRRPSFQGVECQGFKEYATSLASSVLSITAMWEGKEVRSRSTGPQARKYQGLFTLKAKVKSPELPNQCHIFWGWDEMVTHFPARLSSPAAAALSAGGSHPGMWLVPTQNGDILKAVMEQAWWGPCYFTIEPQPALFYWTNQHDFPAEVVQGRRVRVYLVLDVFLRF